MSSPFSVRYHARFAALAENRNLFIAVFVDTVGTGLVLPLSLVYFTLTTNLPLVQIGALSAAATLIALPAGLIAGAVTDRFGAKPAMVSNNLLSALAYILFLTAHGSLSVFLAIFLAAASDRLYWASWTAYVHQLSAGRPFERWFSFLEALKMGAMGIGAVASTIVLAVALVTGLKWLILANIVTSVVAAIIFTAQKIPPVSAAETQHTSRRPRTGLSAWLDFFHDPGAVSLTIGQFLLGPIMVVPNVALSVLLITVWHLPAAVSPLLFAINVALVAVLQTPITHALQTVRRSGQIWAAAILVIAVVLPLAFLPPLGTGGGWTYVVGAGIALGLADILYLPPTNAIMAEAPSPHVRGRAISVHQTAFALSMALYPAMIGLLHSGIPWLLWVITSTAIAGGALFYAIALRRLPLRLRSASDSAAERRTGSSDPIQGPEV